MFGGIDPIGAEGHLPQALQRVAASGPWVLRFVLGVGGEGSRGVGGLEVFWELGKVLKVPEVRA